jgi:hypothetical protein
VTYTTGSYHRITVLIPVNLKDVRYETMMLRARELSSEQRGRRLIAAHYLCIVWVSLDSYAIMRELYKRSGTTQLADFA